MTSKTPAEKFVSSQATDAKQLTKVVKYEILKPDVWVGGHKDGQDCTWPELGKLLRDVQYLSSRIANKFISDFYVAAQQRRHKNIGLSFSARKLSDVNKELREELINNGNFTEEQFNQLSKAGALNSYVIDAINQSFIKPQTSGKNWSEV